MNYIISEQQYKFLALNCSKGILNEDPKSTTKEFIEKAKKVHGDKYDYSKVDYKDAKTPVKIICPIHGEFPQRPDKHLQGECRDCSYETRRLARMHDTEKFIEIAKQKHKNKYDYSKVDYLGDRKKIIIICPKHGEFPQTPSNHKKGHGCPYCRESKGEIFVYNFLKSNGVDVKRKKKFDDCTNEIIGPKCTKLEFDFYIPNMNILIEYDGEQHYKPIGAIGGLEKFKITKKNDKIKNEYAKKNNIPLIRIPHTMKFEDVEKLLIKELNL